MKNAFSGIHPAVGFAFFAAVLTLTMLYMHPVLLAVSLFASASYVWLLKGTHRFLKTLLYLVPVVLLMTVFNALFNHAGVTPLMYLHNGNAVTAEALTFGAFAAVMFSAVILWFSCFNDIMTTDKLMYLFSRLGPSISLLLSMALRFAPRFAEKMRSIAHSRAQIGMGTGKGSFKVRLKNSMSVLSVCLSWALEGSVITANSMKSRGYGAAKRTSFSIYRFDGRDAAALIALIVTLGVTIACVALGGIYARFYPSFAMSTTEPMSVLGISAFALMCFIPHIIDAKEAYVWKRLISAG